METIKIKINQDGVTCKEVNPLGDEPNIEDLFYMSIMYNPKLKHDIRLRKWQEAEYDLKTFEIEEFSIKEPKGEVFYVKCPDERYRLMSGLVMDAEILENGKVRII